MPGARHVRGDRVDLSRDGYHPHDADVYLLTMQTVSEIFPIRAPIKKPADTPLARRKVTSVPMLNLLAIPVGTMSFRPRPSDSTRPMPTRSVRPVGWTTSRNIRDSRTALAGFGPIHAS